MLPHSSHHILHSNQSRPEDPAIDPNAAIQSEKGRAFYNHWCGLRAAGDLIAAQQAFLDNPHPHFAPLVHIGELASDHLIFRLIGTKLVERWGRDKTGQVIGEDQPAAIREALFVNARDAYAHPCGYILEMNFASATGAGMSIEAVVLPLGVSPGRPGRLVSYTDVLRNLPHGEHTDRYLSLHGGHWLDIGAGVPSRPAITVARADLQGR